MNSWYRFWRFMLSLYFRFYHKLECYHPERVPEEGAFLLAVNHVSYLDPPLAGVCCPREIFYLGRKSLFRHWWSNFILRSVNVIPVDLDGSGVSALKAATKQLKMGRGLLIFPEGTRSLDGNLLPPQMGVGWIVLKMGVPVVPVHIWGTNVAMPKKGKGRRAQLEVKFGKLMHFDPKTLPEDRRAASEQIATSIMKEIASLEPHWDKE